jgi:acetylglutamate/LysW-gamma-L-alpha-aminoadipate kinase
MKKKVLGAKEALLGGVDKVVIGDGRIPSPITTAISGKGTVIS